MSNQENNINVSEVLTDFSMSLGYDQLSPEAIVEAKLMLLDVLGVAIVGTEGKPCSIVREWVKHLGGPEESTVIGGGFKAPAVNSVIANGIALRYPEYCGHLQTKDTLIPIHCEESVPAILAMTEKLGLGGKDFITAVVLAAELQGMIGMVANMESQCGIRHTTASIYVIPLVIGKLLGLSREQMINAFGISGSFGLTLHQCHSGEHVVPVRDIVYGLGASNGIRAVELASMGFEGPKEVFEGEWGFLRALGVEGIRARQRLPKLLEKRNGYLINKYGHKMRVGDGTIQSAAQSILDIVRTNSINPKNVEVVKIFQQGKNIYEALENPARKYPINKEDADHSLWYVCARALLDKDLQYPEQFTDAKIKDPEVIKMIDKIKFYVDPELEKEALELGPPAAPGYAEVHLRDGTVYRSKKVKYVDGYGPLKSDKAIKEHFVALSTKYVSRDIADELLDLVDNLEGVQNMAAVMDKVRFLGGGSLSV